VAYESQRHQYGNINNGAPLVAHQYRKIYRDVKNEKPGGEKPIA